MFDDDGESERASEGSGDSKNGRGIRSEKYREHIILAFMKDQ
jgi:hypothetical protein